MDRTRLIEACALLPMLHLPARPGVTALCTGDLAEVLAADILRWPDVSRVHLLAAPLALRDRRVIVGTPPVGSCTLVVCSPGEDPSPHVHAVAPSGIINVSTAVVDHARGLYFGMRQLFRGVVPWREWLPEPLYGAMASPGGGKITRVRHPPPGAKRLSSQYLPCCFTFGKDELPLVLPPQAKARPAHDTNPPAESADPGGFFPT